MYIKQKTKPGSPPGRGDSRTMRKRKYTALLPAPRVEGEEVPPAIIHNIVATTQIESTVKPINLQHIANVLPNSFYDRRKFAAITIRLLEPVCTALLFTSGKLVLTGCRSWNECLLAGLYITRMLRRFNAFVEFEVTDSVIQNIVAHVAVPVGGGQLDLDRLYASFNVQCTYQPQLFPGLIFRPDDSPIVLICFFSGNIVLTGGKNVSDIEIGWRRIWPVVREFIK